MPRRTSTTTGLMRIALVATCWVAACSACLLHGGRSAVRPRAAPRLMATASADLELEMAWCARIVREAADMLAAACVDTHVPGASVLYVMATRTSLLRARGAGQLAPYAHQPRACRAHTAYRVEHHLPGASCVLYVPEAQGGLALLYARRTHTSLGRAVRVPAYRGTAGGGGRRRCESAARVRDDAGAAGHGAKVRVRARV